MHERGREEIWGSFPFLFTVMLLKADVSFCNGLLAPSFAARRGGIGNAAGLRASDKFRECCCAFRKTKTYNQALSWCQLLETGDCSARKPIYTCRGPGPRGEARRKQSILHGRT